MIKTSFNKEDKIIYVARTGEIKIQDLVELVTRIHQEHHAARNLIVLDDVRESISSFEPGDYHLYFKTFSTPEAAKQWLKLESHYI